MKFQVNDFVFIKRLNLYGRNVEGWLSRHDSGERYYVEFKESHNTTSSMGFDADELDPVTKEELETFTVLNV